MYIPEPYKAPNPREIISTHPFATLFSSGADGLMATPTPVFFETDGAEEMVMVGHFAGPNPHAASLTDGDEILAVFSGPHAYISASWYEEKPTVPTWNYVAAHVHGKVCCVEDDAGRRQILSRIAEKSEFWNPQPWTLDDAPDGKVGQLLPHIRAFRILIEKIEGVTKLSQTHPEADQRRVIDGLKERNLPGDAWVADLMKRTVPSA